MKRSLSSRTIILLLISVTSVSFLLFYDFGKSDSRIYNESLSFGHLLLFGMVALVALKILNQGYRLCRDKNLFIRAWVTSSSLGVLTECIQAFIPYRHFRVGDILTDALGAAVFLTLAYSFRKEVSHKNIALMRTGAMVLILLRAYPIFVSTVDTGNMERDFPLLSSFESPLEMSRWSGKDSVSKRLKFHATHGEYSLKVTLLPGVYPGVSQDYLPHDWRGYRYLSFDVYLDGSLPIDISLRINDRTHNENYNDRFHKSFTLEPGHNHLIIDLAEVRKAPQGREMSMADITVFCIFSYKLKETRTFYLDNIRLGK
jgi:VanZ family protein